MHLTTKGRYGLRAAFALARRYGEGPVSLREIAQQQALTEKYLEQLLSALRKAGLVRTVRGACGGYLLAAPPAQIRVWQVLSALEGNEPLVECLGEGSCEREAHCPTRKIWKRLNDAIRDALESVTLQDMMDDSLPEAAEETKERDIE